MSTLGLVWIFLVSIYLPSCWGGCPNMCHQHGDCDDNNTCTCHLGFTGLDCSMRTCETGTAWFDKAHGPNSAHQTADCSNAGICDRSSGKCKCFKGFSGTACQRRTCPNNCNKRGQCVSIRDASVYFGLDYDSSTDVAGDGMGFDYSGWDFHTIQMCSCDDGYTGADCSFVMCPKGDDPLTTDQNYRTIQLEVSTLHYKTLSGDLGLTFQGATTFISLDSPSDVTCTAALLSSPKFSDVECEYTYYMPSLMTFKLTFKSWPRAPKENNIYSHDGNPSISEFYCDISRIDSSTRCSFSDVVASNVQEHEYCSNRGLCNFKTGDCACFDGFGGMACENITNRFSSESNNAVGKEVVVKNPSGFMSTAVRVNVDKSSGTDFQHIVASSNSTMHFNVRGDGNFGVTELRVLDSGVTIARGGMQVEGGFTVSSNGAYVYSTDTSTSALEGTSTNALFSDNAMEINSESTDETSTYLLKVFNRNDLKFALRGDGFVNIDGTGTQVTGGLTIATVGLEISGGMSVINSGMKVTGGVTVFQGGLFVTNGVTIYSNGMKVLNGCTIYDGLNVVDGIVVDAGGTDIEGGGLVVAQGGGSIVAGGMEVTGGLTVNNAGVTATGGTTIYDNGLKVTGGVTLNDDAFVSTGGLSIQSSGLIVTGGISIDNGGTSVTGGISLASGGAVVTGGMSVLLAGVKVANGITIVTTGASYGLEINSGGMVVTGGMSVLDSGLSATSGITVENGGLSVSAAGLTVEGGGMKVTDGLTVHTDGMVLEAGGVHVTGGLSVHDLGLTAAGGLTVDNTGLYVTSDGLTINADGMKVVGGITVLDSGVEVTSGGIDVTGGFTVSDLGMKVAGGSTVSSGYVVVTDGATVSAGGLKVAGGLSVDSVDVEGGGLDVAGGLTVFTGSLQVTGGVSSTELVVDSGGMNVDAGGVEVSGGMTATTGGLIVESGGMRSTGGLTVQDTGAKVAGGMTVQSSGMVISANGATFPAGMSAGGGITVSDGGLQVDSSGIEVNGGISVLDSTIFVTGGVTISSSGFDTGAGGATFTAGGLKVDSGLTMNDLVVAANLFVTNGLTASSMAIRGGLTVDGSGFYAGGASSIYGDSYASVDLSIVGSLTGTFVTTSDRRLKRDISPLKNSLESITKLRGVYFKWSKESNQSKRQPNRQIGVIAQDVAKVYPEIVSKIRDSDYLGVRYSQLVPIMIEAIRELNEKYTSLDEDYKQLGVRAQTCSCLKKQYLD